MHEEPNDKPGGDRLPQFGGDLDAIRPRLSPAAIRWTEIRRAIGLVLSVGSLAAAMVLTAVFVFTSLPTPADKDATTAAEPAGPSTVCDRLHVAVTAPEASSTSQSPLVPASPPKIDGRQDAAPSQITVRAQLKRQERAASVYEGGVETQLGRIRIRSGRLDLSAGGAGRQVTLKGSGDVIVDGLPGFDAGIRADHFFLQPDAGSLVFEGDVRLGRPGGKIKCRLCTVTLAGEIVRSKTLLDDFAASKEIARKLALLDRIAKVYADDELPPEASYLLAMKLLRPHLTWHKPYDPPKEFARPDMSSDSQTAKRSDKADARQNLTRDRRAVRERQQAEWRKVHEDEDGWRWSEAHAGEPWMHEGDAPGQFWRLKDRRHKDVARAVKLLQRTSANNKDFQRRSHWLAEIDRNNTVVTMDVIADYPLKSPGPVVIDVRNAERLTARLYQVRRPADLVSAAQRIGEDFVYCDYGLQYAGMAETARALRAVDMAERQIARLSRRPCPAMDLKPGDVVYRWNVFVADLLPLDFDRQWRAGMHDDDYDEDDPEAEYFDDRCQEHRARLRKSYWPGDEPSSWRCDRLLKIPSKAVRDPGAYILAVEANGQTAYAPVVIEPLALAMRRCRDGVFVLASDGRTEKPLAGAEVHAPGMLGQAATNADGVAFARVFAAGDRPIVIEKAGRWAIGGFGDVFEGIYRAYGDRDREMLYQRLRVARQAVREVESAAEVYADRHIVAAYTDRPTYRPDQEVNFKLIVRRLGLGTDCQSAARGADCQSAAPDGKSATGPTTAFRAEDFDWADHLELPKAGGDVQFEVVDPRGNRIGGGTVKLSDFGTAAGRLRLSSEARVGAYTLRVNVAGMVRIVPHVFAVQHYRRPNFELTMTGTPEEIAGGQALKLQLAGKYYFGPPVVGGKVEVRLVQPQAWKPLVRRETPLDAAGNAQIELPLPDRLGAGEYRLIGSLRDSSGRTVTQTVACRVKGPAMDAAGDALRGLPRFVAVGEALDVKTTAPKITAQPESAPAENAKQPVRAVEPIEFASEGGVARIKLSKPGWYVLSDGRSRTEVFAYGGEEPPDHKPLPALHEAKGPKSHETARWIDLTDYESEEDGHWRGCDADSEGRLLALLDRQHVRVGDRLRVLVYVPAKQAKVLLTIEGRTILDYLITQIETKQGFYHVLEVPIKPRYIPNFYLQGRILSRQDLVHHVLREKLALQAMAERVDETDDQSEDPRWCRIDVLDPNARPGGQKLNVKIETDAATYRPGGKVDVRIQATDLAGKPREAEVSLAAVDESVFSFGEDRVDLLAEEFSNPRPEQRFMRKTWRVGQGGAAAAREMQAAAQAMKMAEQARQMAQQAAQLDQLQQSLAGYRAPEDLRVPLTALEGELPATRIPLARLRTDFRETAAWQPLLRTGSDGRVSTSFVLPDSLTRYRLTGVGVTRGTEIGVGRARIEAAMPLAVQLLLPRFAVERDRLEAVGLVHNGAEAERTCTVFWEIAGARVAIPRGESGRWNVVAAEDKTLVEGRVKVAPGKPARIALVLAFDRLGGEAQGGEVRVSLRAADGKDADAEVRRLTIQPLGTPREVAMTGSFAGRHEVRLPAGFVARDLHVSISRADVAQALEGLRYLIDYPYGCVEQTMSRFLPAVMVKRAIQETPVALPPDVAQKLPDVLQKGLQRLYGFQHDDGGWGWWEKDNTNDAMTSYVVYGLARCRSTGTPVDQAALDRGCNWIARRLQSGQVAPQYRSGAWLALALAGRADKAALTAEAQRLCGAGVSPANKNAGVPPAPKDEATAPPPVPGAAVDPSEQAAQVALACRAAGMIGPAEELWPRVRAWEPASTEGLAVKLAVQIARGAPLPECRMSTAKLLARRSGDRWECTRATAWAVEALSQMLAYDSQVPPAKRVSITVGKKTALDLTTPQELKPPVYRLHLDAAGLPADEALAISLLAEGPSPVNFTLTARGIQRLDRFEPPAGPIRVTRTLTAVDGKPLPERVRVGDVVAVRLAIDLAAPQSYVIVEDRRPAGCEFADDQLAGPLAGQAAHVEFRDDRVAAFFTSLGAGRHELTYYLRAETRGTSHILPGTVYPMYHEKVRGESAGTQLTIE